MQASRSRKSAAAAAGFMYLGPTATEAGLILVGCTLLAAAG